LENLPETPVTASGINIRWQFDSLPDRLLTTAGLVDDTLSDAGYSIVSRFMRRTVKWHQGVINIELTENRDATGVLTFNFHLESGLVADHIDWLSKVHEMVSTAQELNTSLVGTKLQ
jgi:hypothetical protein